MRAIACKRYGRDTEVAIECEADDGYREWVILVRRPMREDGEPPIVGRAYPATSSRRHANEYPAGMQARTFQGIKAVPPNLARRALGWQSVGGLLARVLACEALGLDAALLVGSYGEGLTCPFCGKWPLLSD